MARFWKWAYVCYVAVAFGVLVNVFGWLFAFGCAVAIWWTAAAMFYSCPPAATTRTVEVPVGHKGRVPFDDGKNELFYEWIDCEVKRLNVGKGDLVAITVDGVLCDEARCNLNRSLTKLLPDNKFVLFEEGVRVDVKKPPELESVA